MIIVPVGTNVNSSNGDYDKISTMNKKSLKGLLKMYNEKLKELRIDYDKTQQEIATVLKVGQSYYSKQERGEKPIQIEQLITLCTYYGVSADYILGLPRGLSWPR